MGFITGLFISLRAINIQKSAEKIVKNAHEKLLADLNAINRELTQTNLTVAALDIRFGDRETGQFIEKEPISELWLRQLDDDFKIKETITSIEKVILARQREVDGGMQKYEENRKKARRAVTSSVGGLATGFVTYEMGSAVKNFVLLGKGQDPISYGYWLEAVVQHGSAPEHFRQMVASAKCDTIENLNLQEQKEEEQKTSSGIESHQKNENSSETTQPQIQKTATGIAKQGHQQELAVKDCLQKHLIEHYQQPEMLAQAILLTVVLFVSSVAAYIGWQKGADDA